MTKTYYKIIAILEDGEDFRCITLGYTTAKAKWLKKDHGWKTEQIMFIPQSVSPRAKYQYLNK